MKINSKINCFFLLLWERPVLKKHNPLKKLFQENNLWIIQGDANLICEKLNLKN
jgi:hypothetical protein